jgi:hypothetical protein
MYPEKAPRVVSYTRSPLVAARAFFCVVVILGARNAPVVLLTSSDAEGSIGEPSPTFSIENVAPNAELVIKLAAKRLPSNFFIIHPP